jgi:propanediol utilization protein
VSREHLDTLFGNGYELKVDRPLSQTGQYAARERVALIGRDGKRIDGVRILGPVRAQTQVELSRTDGYLLGLAPPVRDSGTLVGSPAVTVEGPRGRITLPEGVILSLRHIHMSPDDARALGVVDKERVQVVVSGDRALVFDKVIVRVGEKYVLELHLDTDEANAAGLKNGDLVHLLRKEGDLPRPAVEVKQVTKRLIREEDVRRAIAGGYRLQVGRGTVVTPSALDLGRAKGVLIGDVVN